MSLPSLVVNDGNVAVNPKQNGHAQGPSTSAVLHRSLHTAPLKVISAQGSYLTLEDGQQILDATGGAAVACIGHGDPSVKEAVMKQMDQVSYCHSLFFSSSGAENLAKLLIDSTEGVMAKAFIVSSGSEAMEAAMKLARQYYLELQPAQPDRIRFIARKESYHGNTLGALALSGHVARRKLFKPMLSENVTHVSPCNAYRGMRSGESIEAYVDRLAQELDDEFKRVGPHRVCAFVAEPVVGAALGCVPSVPGYLKAMKAICKKHGALLILDEVMCGMGRTGSIHAWQQEGITPDLQTIGKGLGGGYAPIAGVLMTQRIVDALDRGTGSFMHGHTYQGHPLACAVAFQVQTVVRDQRLVENVAAMGKLLEEGLKNKLAHHPNVGDIRGRGLFWGIEFVEDKESKKAFPADMGVEMRVHERGMQKPYNISLYPGSGSVDGLVGDHVIVAPAYNVNAQDIDLIVQRTVQVVQDIFKDGIDS
ncbi:hypothetical protein MMC13_005284 [Lambiella insularis]|nr:hypothetical protein [Lambiella insularis]